MIPRPSTPIKEDVVQIERTSFKDQLRKDTPYMKISRNSVQRIYAKAYLRNKLPLLNHPQLSFSRSNLLSKATTTFHKQLKSTVWNTTVSLDKWTCDNFVDVGKSLDINEQFFLSKGDYNLLDVKQKAFQKNDSNNYQPERNFTMGEADLNQILKIQNQPVFVAENIIR